MEKATPFEKHVLTMLFGAILSYIFVGILVNLGADQAAKVSFLLFLATTNAFLWALAYRYNIPFRQIDAGMSRVENYVINRLTGRR